MKLMNYAVSVMERAEGQAQRHIMAFRAGGLAGVTAGLMSVPTVIAFAEESANTNLLDETIWALVTKGFGDLALTCTMIVALALTTGISIVGMTTAGKYAIKKIKGTLSAAA